MNLALDTLLADLRSRTADVLVRIDADTLLLKRQAGELVLANATKLLFSPQEEHQLFAKGIVYSRSPYRLVSLPLVKIYNLGEKEVTAADVAILAAGGELHFLRKFDGTLVQRFQHANTVVFTTRGVIEGGPQTGPQDDDAPANLSHFDFLGNARRVAAASYPALLEPRPALEGLTLVFEFLHPDAQVITNYAGRQDLVLIAAFDVVKCRYLTYGELRAVAAAHALAVVDAFTPAGGTLAEQIESLLIDLRGTDQEGTVLTIERGGELVYRVKVKSPDYLRILKLVVTCTYPRTVELLDAHPELTTWPELEAYLRALGNEKVPEEVLAFYREHYDAFIAYLADCERLREWAVGAAGGVVRSLAEVTDPRERRKRFATAVAGRPHAGMLFAAFDGRLTATVVRKYIATPADAAAAVAKVLA